MEEHNINPELEALQSTYADDLKISQLSPSLTFTLNIVPRTADDATNRFVEAVLEVAVPESYPEALPVVELASSKGVGDARSAQLIERMNEEALSMKGEAMLGQLCEAAFDVITEMNQPEGDCGICLEPLKFEQNGQYEKGELVKLSCFHVFHGKCFLSWWTHQQNEFQKKEQEMKMKTGITAASRVLEKELPEKIDGFYVVDCPICRTPIYPSDLKPWMDLDAQMTPAALGWTGGDSAPISQVLPAQDLKVLKQQQDEWAEKLADQAKRGGIVDANIIALALPDMQPSAPPLKIASTGEDPIPPVEDIKNLSIHQGDEPRKPRVVGINGKTIALALPAVFGGLADDVPGDGEEEERDELSEMQGDKAGEGEKEGSQYHRRCSSHGDLVNRFSSYGGSGKPQQSGSVEQMGEEGSDEASFWDAAPQPVYSQPRGRKGRSDAENWRDPGPRRGHQGDGGFPRGRGRRDGSGWRGQGNNDRGRGRSDGRGLGRYGNSQDWGRGGRWRDGGRDNLHGGNNDISNWDGGPPPQGRPQFSQDGRGRRGRGNQVGRGRGRGQDNVGFDGGAQMGRGRGRGQDNFGFDGGAQMGRGRGRGQMSFGFDGGAQMGRGRGRGQDNFGFDGGVQMGQGQGQGRGQDNFGIEGGQQDFDLGGGQGGGMFGRGRGRMYMSPGGRSFDASLDPSSGRGFNGGYGQGPGGGGGGGMNFDGFMDFPGGMLGRGPEQQGQGYGSGNPGRGNFAGRAPRMNASFDGIGLDPGFNDFGSGGRGCFGGRGRHEGGRGRFNSPGFDDGGLGGLPPYESGRGRYSGRGFDTESRRGYGSRGGMRGRGYGQNDAFGRDHPHGMGDGSESQGRGRRGGRDWGRGRGGRSRDGQGRGGNQEYQ